MRHTPAATCLTLLLMLIVIVLGRFAYADPSGQPRALGQMAQQLQAEILQKVAGGQMTPQQANDLLGPKMGPNLSGDEVSEIMKNVEKEYAKTEKGKAEAKKNADQAKAEHDQSLSRSKSFRWPWGELFEQTTYNTKLTITNECRMPEIATLAVSNLPLTVPPSVVVPAKSSIEVALTITTPKLPAPYILPGTKITPEMTYLEVKGKLTVTHPASGRCFERIEDYTVYGHVHYRPAADPQAQKNATKPECEAVWALERRPRGLANAAAAIGGEPERSDLQECTDELRELALDLRSQLGRDAIKAPDDWKWLPEPNDIASMSLKDLVDFKARAGAQLRGTAPDGERLAEDPAHRRATDAAADPMPENPAFDRRRVDDLRADIKRLAAQDPSLRAPKGAAMDAELAPLSLTQLTALRDRLEARVNREIKK